MRSLGSSCWGSRRPVHLVCVVVCAEEENGRRLYRGKADEVANIWRAGSLGQEPRESQEYSTCHFFTLFVYGVNTSFSETIRNMSSHMRRENTEGQ